MSELDEFGIIRYIVDTGDKVYSILINDIAEEPDKDNQLFMLPTKYCQLDWKTRCSSVEYILIGSGKYYVKSSERPNGYITVFPDIHTTKFGRTLWLLSSDMDSPYDLTWLLHNKSFGSSDGGLLERNYRIYNDIIIIIVYDDYSFRFEVDMSTIHNFEEFERYVAIQFNIMHKSRRKNKALNEMKKGANK